MSSARVIEQSAQGVIAVEGDDGFVGQVCELDRPPSCQAVPAPHHRIEPLGEQRVPLHVSRAIERGRETQAHVGHAVDQVVVHHVTRALSQLEPCGGSPLMVESDQSGNRGHAQRMQEPQRDGAAVGAGEFTHACHGGIESPARGEAYLQEFSSEAVEFVCASASGEQFDTDFGLEHRYGPAHGRLRDRKLLGRLPQRAGLGNRLEVPQLIQLHTAHVTCIKRKSRFESFYWTR